MTPSENAYRIFRHYEQGPNGGPALTPYLCPAGKLTLGYGHVVLPGEVFTAPLTLPQCDELLVKDLAVRVVALERLLKTTPTQQQFDALLSWVFNIGEHNASTSTLIRYFNKNLFQLTSAEFGRWVYSKGKILDGLVKRRLTEQRLFLTGNLTLY